MPPTPSERKRRLDASDVFPTGDATSHRLETVARRHSHARHEVPQQSHDHHIPTSVMDHHDGPIPLSVSSQSERVTNRVPNPHISPLKVAIPRLDPFTRIIATPSSDKTRVSHACQACRVRKVKCSGERPVCNNCTKHDIKCTYVDGRREKAKQEHHQLKEAYAQALDLLRTLSPYADEDMQTKIRILSSQQIDEHSDYAHQDGMAPIQQEGPPYMDVYPRDRNESPKAANDPNLRTRSKSSPDTLNDDLDENDNTRARGFIGMNSDIQWLRYARKQFESGEGGATAGLQYRYVSPQTNTAKNTITDTYHLDIDPVWLSKHIFPHELPDSNTCDRLVKYYFDTVHDSFPILDREFFQEDYKALSEDHRRYGGKSQNVLQKPKAILNLVFAISAKYGSLIGDPRFHQDDHTIYSTRARALALTADSWMNHADLVQTQFCGLLSLYLMIIHQPSRAWTMVGVALRYALSLGLHVQSKAPNLSIRERSVRNKIWWVLCSVEQQLGALIDRSNHVAEAYYSSVIDPMKETIIIPQKDRNLRTEGTIFQYGHDPQSYSESSRSFGDAHSLESGGEAYYLIHLELSRITKAVVTRLYTVGPGTDSWSVLQGSIHDIRNKLKDWVKSLPHEYNFTLVHKKPFDQYERYRTILAFHYYRCEILAMRPSLCQADQNITRASTISKYDEFKPDFARDCVHAAQKVVELLPSEPNAAKLYQLGPWWCQTSLIMQAAAIIFLEISFGNCHMDDEEESIWESLEKLLSWIHELARSDKASNEGWKIARQLTVLAARSSNRPLPDVINRSDPYSDSSGSHPVSFPPSAQPRPSMLRPSLVHMDEMGWLAKQNHPLQGENADHMHMSDIDPQLPLEPQMFANWPQESGLYDDHPANLFHIQSPMLDSRFNNLSHPGDISPNRTGGKNPMPMGQLTSPDLKQYQFGEEDLGLFDTNSTNVQARIRPQNDFNIAQYGGTAYGEFHLVDNNDAQGNGDFLGERENTNPHVRSAGSNTFHNNQ